MSIARLKATKKKVVGIKQTLKAIERGEVSVVFIARDADHHVLKQLHELVAQKNIPVVDVETMLELGRACGIKVGAAVAALLSE